MEPLRIMIAEDDPVIAMFLGEVLKDMGHEICATEFTQSGAVATAARCDPDLMIVDARLGEGSGIFAVDEILSHGFVPHVFTSGDRALLRRLARDAVVIEKPFHEAQLASAIALAMARPKRRTTAPGGSAAAVPPAPRVSPARASGVGSVIDRNGTG
jgi:CheY-like chemotaxis protein